MEIDKKCQNCASKHPEHICIHQREHAISLDQTKVDTEYSIVCNPYLKYFEMGLSHGSPILVIKNTSSDRNLIIGVGDSRYIISRNIAKRIMVL